MTDEIKAEFAVEKAKVAIEKSKEALPHDGWGSRTVILGGVMFAVCTIAVGFAVGFGREDDFLKIAPWLGDQLQWALGFAIGGITVKSIAQAFKRQ